MDIRYSLKKLEAPAMSYMERKYIIKVIAYNQSRYREQFLFSGADDLDLMSGIWSDNQLTQKLSQERIEKILNKEITSLVKTVSFKKDMSPKDANAMIEDLLNEAETDKFDKKVERLFNDRYKEYHAMEQYHFIEVMKGGLSDKSVGAIKAVLFNQKQKAADKMKDFVKGGAIDKENREVITSCFNKLDEENKENFTSLLEKNDFDIRGNYDEFLEFTSSLWKKVELSRPHPDRVIKPSEAIARVAVDLLRDELQYKYFKQTGNTGIFFSDKEKEQIQNMSNNDILDKHSDFAWQYHRDAYIIGEHIKRFGKDATALGAFVSKFDDYAYQVAMKNQDIIRMYFDILKTNFNKFNIQESKELTRFAASLAEYSKDNRIAQQIRDTFGIKPFVYDPYQKNQDTYKKEQTKKRLEKAAKRIEKGDYISGAVIANEMADIESKYAVKPTKETTKKIKSNHGLSEAQKKILQKYKGRY